MYLDRWKRPSFAVRRCRSLERKAKRVFKDFWFISRSFIKKVLQQNKLLFLHKYVNRRKSIMLKKM